MSHNLSLFENVLKKTVSCDVEFLHSPQIQTIIDYFPFNYNYLYNNIFKGVPRIVSVRDSFLNDDIFFRSNINSLVDLIKDTGILKFKFVYCIDSSFNIGVIYIIGFSAYSEEHCYQYMQKLINLKAFI